MISRRLRMVKLIVVGMLVLGVCCIYPSNHSLAENLVSNPSFEETIEVQYIDGWGIVSVNKASINSNQSRSGSNCLELEREASTPWLRVCTGVVIDAKEEYILSGYVKTVGVKEDGAYIWIPWRGQKSGERGYVKEQKKLFFGGTTEWEKYEVVISPDNFPEQEEKVMLTICLRWRWNDSKGKAYFDDISLVKKGSTVNLIKNPGFEGKFSTGKLPMGLLNVILYGGSSGKAKIVCDSSVFRNGKNSLKFEEGGQITMRVPKFDEKGRAIRISTWIKTEDVDNCQCCLATGFTDANGKYMPVSIPEKGKDNFSGTNDWAYFEKIIKLPAGVSQSLTIWLIRKGKDKGTVWFDDVCVEEIRSFH